MAERDRSHVIGVFTEPYYTLIDQNTKKSFSITINIYNSDDNINLIIINVTRNEKKNPVNLHF